MLSSHLQNGIDTAKMVWSRLPHTEDGDFDTVGISKKNDSTGNESLDYEVIENYAYREEQEKRGKLFVGYQVCFKWFLALLIGIGTGLAAIFINISVENFAGWKYSLTFAIIQKSYFAGFLVYVLINLALVFSSVYIVTKFAPAAAGSGIPEIKGYLNGVDIHGILLLRTLIGKIFGTIGSVGGGLALGKEGILVHTGACIASLPGQVKCYMKQLFSGLEHCHKNGVMHRDIKGSNLLIADNGIMKITDFGLATMYNLGCKQPMTKLLIGKPILPGRTKSCGINNCWELRSTGSNEWFLLWTGKWHGTSCKELYNEQCNLGTSEG